MHIVYIPYIVHTEEVVLVQLQENENIHYITFSHLADAFIQSDLQMRTMEAIKINKKAMICKCYYKSQLA